MKAATHRLRNGILYTALIVGGVVVLNLSAPVPAPDYTLAQISERVDKLNYAAAINTPHRSLGKSERAQNQVLFEAVEQGKPLSSDQSSHYRGVYQSILRNNQWFLSLFDRNLTVVHDHAMTEPNNLGGKGIVGDHDHHDFSAASNLSDLRRSLARVEDPATSGLARVIYTVCVHKDMTDIILHMATAPQTKSTSYHEVTPQDELDRLFANVMVSYKAAQFDPLNSPDYIKHLHAALAAYDELVLHVQGRISTRLSPWQKIAAGRWLAWQSAGPNLEHSPPGGLARNIKPTKGVQ